MLDYGVHPPTIYFPQIVDEAMMIEPTETESKEELDRFIDLLFRIDKEAYSDPQKLIKAPQNTAIGRIDEAKASSPKTLCLTWKMFKEKEKNLA